MLVRTPLQSSDTMENAAHICCLYLYPLMVMDAFRHSWSRAVNKFEPAPQREWGLASTLIQRPACSATVGAWLDLTAGPVSVVTPDLREKPMVATLVDAWGQSSAVTRFFQPGDASIRRCVFVGPDKSAGSIDAANGDLCRVGTRQAWLRIDIVGRTDADYDAIRYFAGKCRVFPEHRRRGALPRQAQFVLKTPHRRVANLGAEPFFCIAMHLLELNPQTESESEPDLATAMQMLRLKSGRRFSLLDFTPATAEAIKRGVREACARVGATHDATARGLAENWSCRSTDAQAPASAEPISHQGYLRRAANARMAPYQCHPGDLTLLRTSVDSEGRALTGAQRYRLHFKPEALPRLDVFWTLALIGKHACSVLKGANRSIGNRHPFVVNNDGSFDIIIESSSSTSWGVANWLRPPGGQFALQFDMMRSRGGDDIELFPPPSIERFARPLAVHVRRELVH